MDLAGAWAYFKDMNGVPFTKMHGLGNDFVVLDARARPLAMNPGLIRGIADRRTGVGCDQLIVIEPPANGKADAFMRIYNADGGEVGACGNGARCVADVLLRERRTDRTTLATATEILEARRAGPDSVTVDMGPARLDWREIPLAEARDTLHVGISHGVLNDPVAVSMGNPHAIFFVPDVAAVPLAEVGPGLEHHPLFPERTNVEAVQVLSPTRIRVRVWERGVGITQACGTGACAALVAANRRGLTERAADVVLDGGTLKIEWLVSGRVLMTGPVATSFTGVLDADRLARQ